MTLLLFKVNAGGYAEHRSTAKALHKALGQKKSRMKARAQPTTAGADIAEENIKVYCIITS